MSEFFSFLVRHLFSSIITIAALALAAFGYVQQGLDIYAFGLGPWVFQLAGFLTFAAVVIRILYEWDKKILVLPEPAPPVSSGPSPDMEAVLVLGKAKRKAATALIHHSDVEMHQSAVFEMRAALLTAHKVFGLPIPEITDETDGAKRGLAYLEEVLPFLARGHVEEASQIAQKFID